MRKSIHSQPLSGLLSRKGTRRSGFNNQTVLAIWDRDEGKCVYCGEPAACIDHIFPVSRGGPGIKANGALACRYCNSHKGARINIDTLTRAFYHLLMKGESLEWIDKALEGED